MKLLLFTPVVKSSAIGRMASLVAKQLLKLNHEVVVIRTENETLFKQPMHDFAGTPVSWTATDKVKKLTESADALIHQIGDNYNFHQGSISWLSELSGIVCLHDFYVSNLFYSWSRECNPDAMKILKTWYGPEVSKKFFNYYKNAEDFIVGTSNTAPLTEWICSMAQGVITHSSWGIERLLNSCPGPVWTVPLVYDAPEAKLLDNSPFTIKKDKLHLLTIGHVNKNKRAASVIKALGQSNLLREQTVYQLVGHISSEIHEELSDLAKKNQVNLIISGELDSVAVLEAIKTADMMVCLRWPALEAASASTIEALLYGKATLVTKTGFYNEIPDECVIKINPDNEIPEIRDELLKLVSNPEQFSSISKQGQLWANKTFRADNYALKLTELILSTTRTKVVTNAVNYFTQLLHDWGAQGKFTGEKYITEPLSIFEKIS